MDTYNPNNYLDELKKMINTLEEDKSTAKIEAHTYTYIDKIYENISVAYDTEFMTWLKQEAHKNNSTAQNFLGYIYENSLGLTKNLPNAIKWYKLSANNNNNMFAQRNLAIMYKDGIGMKANLEEAKRLITLSAEQGNRAAQNNLGNTLYFEQDYTGALKWYEASAKQSYMFGQFNLAEMYKNGKGVDVDFKKAITLYKLCADVGNMHAVGEIKQIFKMVPPSSELADDVWRRYFEYDYLQAIVKKQQDKIKLLRQKLSVIPKI